jgi:hypothetical protein
VYGHEDFNTRSAVMKMSKKLGGLLGLVVIASVGCAGAATLVVVDNTNAIPKDAWGNTYAFHATGAAVTSGVVPNGGSANFPIMNAPGKDIPVATTVQLQSCGSVSCSYIGYPKASIGWSATSDTVYTFDISIDQSNTHGNTCATVTVDGKSVGSKDCSPESVHYQNWQTTGIVFSSGSTVVLTLSNS